MAVYIPRKPREFRKLSEILVKAKRLYDAKRPRAVNFQLNNGIRICAKDALNFTYASPGCTFRYKTIKYELDFTNIINLKRLRTRKFLFYISTHTVVYATATIQDILYTSKVAGSAGNSISIEYTGGATAGAEVVTVVGNAITVQIETTVSTVDDILAAIIASTEASALIAAAATGTGLETQVTQVATNLTNG